MRTALLTILAVLLLAAPAAANTATQAISTPYSNQELWRPCGQELASGFAWNCPTPADAKVDPTSAEQRKFLTDQMGTSWEHPGNWWAGYWAIYTVDGDTPYKSVCLTGADNWASGWADYVQAHKNLVLNKVPIPTDPSGDLPWKDGGSDNGVTIYQPDSNAAWDFYEFRKAPAGTVDSITGRTCDYQADVGQKLTMIGKHGVGYNRDGSKYQITYSASAISPGYYRQNPPQEFSDVARRASKLPVIAGNITPQEWNDPSATDGFGHKLQGTLPWGRYQQFSWPAHATDAWSPWGFPAIKEGAILRFDSKVPCGQWDAEIGSTTSADRKLFLRRIRAVCVTIQKYGIVNGDQTGQGFSPFSFAGGGAHVGDGGSCCDGHGNPGDHWPSQYIDSVWGYFRDNLEVLEEPAHVEWTPGCRC